MKMNEYNVRLTIERDKGRIDTYMSLPFRGASFEDVQSRITRMWKNREDLSGVFPMYQRKNWDELKEVFPFGINDGIVELPF